jgi:hypothetical protein
MFKIISACILYLVTSQFAHANADGCVAPDSLYDQGMVYTYSSSCVDVRGKGKTIDFIRGGVKLQRGVSTYGTTYITLSNGAAFFTAVELFDNSRGKGANTKWSQYYQLGYSVPKGQACAAFYEWNGSQWINYAPACVNIK